MRRESPDISSLWEDKISLRFVQKPLGYGLEVEGSRQRLQEGAKQTENATEGICKAPH